MTKYIPQLIIKYAYPLDQERRNLYLNKNFGPYPDAEKVISITEHINDLWSQLNTENKVIKLLTEITEINLNRDIEVFIIGAGLKPMSTPFIMPILNRKGEICPDKMFIDTLIHETTHIFVADTKRTPRLKNYWDYAKKEYEKEEPSTLHHIVVYAVLIELYTRLFGEENINKYIILENLPKSYLRAWEIVKENGYQNIIEKFCSLTKENV